MALPLIPSIQDKSISLDRLTELLQAPENIEDENALFTGFSADESFIGMLNASF